jgi:PKD repeat protein
MIIARLYTAARYIRTFSRNVRSWTVIAGFPMVACGGGDLVLPSGGGPTALRVVDGDGQTGSVGQLLDSPVIVELTDARGDPVSGVTIEFALTSAGDGAEAVPSNASTDSVGLAQARVLLGSKVGLQTGEARVFGEGGTLLKASFTAQATSNSPPNARPRADFSSDCEKLTCQFEDGSSDSDGNLTGWIWTFGDGGSSTEREPVHGYSAPGTYTVSLTVVDDDGATDETSTQVTASPAPAPPSNRPPRADFEVSCEDLRCSFTDRSDDPDGSIAGHQWDFGDGTTSSQRNPSHSYQTAGQYEVALTVTDNRGGENTKTRTAGAEAPAPQPPPERPPPPPAPEPNKPPAAEFEVQCSGLTCSFIDRSKDDDGSLVHWRWSFGDGATSNDRNPSHSYQTAGRYQVLLTVTDNDGAADAKTGTAEPTAPAPPPPPEPNRPPHADFEVRCSGLTCTFKDKSKDDDGNIVSWQWSFGDGAGSSQQNPVHTYAQEARFDVVLTVTDNDGTTSTRTREADPKEK